LLSGKAVPLDRLGIVLWDAIPFLVHRTKVILCDGIASLGERQELIQRRLVVASLVSCHAIVEVRPHRWGNQQAYGGDDNGSD